MKSSGADAPSLRAGVYALLEKELRYNHPNFIETDPVSIPHLFTRKQDIEISGFFAAILAWGQRKAIIRNASRLMEYMDNSPYDFILHHHERDLKACASFVHRTFNSTDLLYFIHWLQQHYKIHTSLEDAFIPEKSYPHDTVENALIQFRSSFFSLDHPPRTTKHISTPEGGSACKRINMFLRWMVRKDKQGVDFGIWKKIRPAQLICPLDIHVARTAFHLGLIPDMRSNWKNAMLLTEQLKALDPEDPVKYDFALFGIGINGKSSPPQSC